MAKLDGVWTDSRDITHDMLRSIVEYTVALLINFH